MTTLGWGRWQAERPAGRGCSEAIDVEIDRMGIIKGKHRWRVVRSLEVVRGLEVIVVCWSRGSPPSYIMRRLKERYFVAFFF